MDAESGKVKRRVALSSVVAALFLTGAKLAVGLVTGSLGILSEAAHSALDLGAAFMTYVAVKISDKPADETHHYGHGKIEGLSAFIEVLLLLITCVYIIYEAIERIMTGKVHVDVTVYAFVVMGFSIVVDISRSTALYRAAKKYGSQALEADALHFSSDIFSSLVVIVGLVCYRYFNLPLADSIAALVVAVLVIVVSIRLAVRTVHVLLDRAPDGLRTEIQREVLATDGVTRVDVMRIRTSGTKTFVDLQIRLSANLSLSRAHGIADMVEGKIAAVIPNADVMIHTEPDGDTQQPRKKRAEVARLLREHSGMIEGFHNMKVYQDGENCVISVHVEMKGDSKLAEVHRVCDHLERDIRKHVPGVNITIHVEPGRQR